MPKQRLQCQRPQPPSSLSISAFCTCSRFSASSTATQLGASRTASVASTLRRTGRARLYADLTVSSLDRYPGSILPLVTHATLQRDLFV